MTNGDGDNIFACVFADLAIVYHTQSLSKAVCVIPFTHQELIISMYRIRGQLETLTDTLINRYS